MAESQEERKAKVRTLDFREILKTWETKTMKPHQLPGSNWESPDQN